MMNDHNVRAVHDLSVHPDHKFFTIGDFYSVGVTVVSSSPDVPSVWSDPGCVIVVDYYGPGSARNKCTVEKFLGFSIYFNEH